MTTMTTRGVFVTTSPLLKWVLLLLTLVSLRTSETNSRFIVGVAAFQQLQQQQPKRQQAVATNQLFATEQQRSSSSSSHKIKQETMVCTRMAVNNEMDQSKRRRRRCRPCESVVHENDLDLDRREATFALLGTLWALTTTAITVVVVVPTSAAHAAYGQEAKITLPNPVEQMIQRATQQCVVESLGSRECLVFADADNTNRLYQGADGGILLQRLQQAVVALSTIPDLVASKKWSAVSGVLTGPMGTLVSTMNQLLQLRPERPKAEQLAKRVKQDLFSISAAADRKQEEAALKGHQQATADLVAFLQALEE